MWKMSSPTQNPTAKELVVRAVDCEISGFIMEAIALYDDAIVEQMRTTRSELNPERSYAYRKLLRDYELHVYQMKKQVQKHMFASKLINQIAIEDGSRGHSYAKMFGQYFNEDVREFHIYEPKLAERSHFTNLANLLQLVVKRCRSLSYVRVYTRVDPNMPHNQMKTLNHIGYELNTGFITFNFKLDDTMHERKLVLSNGFIIKISRGLHYFKHCETMHSLGVCDFDFRKCFKTEVEIWRTAPFASAPA